MTDLSEEQKAEAIKAFRIRMMPLAEALAYATQPVYGFTEEVCGLQHNRHSVHMNVEVLIAYRSPLYAQYAFRNDTSFVVKTRIIEEGKKLAFGLIASSIEAALVAFDGCPSDEFAALFEAKEKACVLLPKKLRSALMEMPSKAVYCTILRQCAIHASYSTASVWAFKVMLSGQALKS